MNCKMKLLIFALAVSILGSRAAAASVPVNATTMIDKGTINVNGYGTVHVVTPWNGNIVVHDNGFTLKGNTRIYFATRPDIGDPYIYWQTPLLGKRFSYEIDVSNVGCHCNADAYFSNLPGHNSAQQLEPGPGGDYYCDANFVNNNFCPEYDLFEGNKHTMVSTLHTCDFVPPSYFPNCDRAGCGTNAYNINPNMMCPEDRCTINTQKLYTVTHSHITGSDGTLNTINIKFSQEGRSANFNVCGTDTVKYMGYSLNGIVFAASIWTSSDMSWLDGMTGCQGQCDLAASTVTFKNFALLPI